MPGALSAVNKRLDGKTILVTAAAAGIGRASAIRMASEGARVIATDIDVKGLESLPTELAIEKLPLDVTDESAIRALASARPTIDVLFNCAGIVPAGTVLDCSLQDWSTAFSINVTSCFLMIQAFLPGMLARGEGSIVNMASVASSIKGVPNRFCYGATKARGHRHHEVGRRGFRRQRASDVTQSARALWIPPRFRSD